MPLLNCPEQLLHIMVSGLLVACTWFTSAEPTAEHYESGLSDGCTRWFAYAEPFSFYGLFYQCTLSFYILSGTSCCVVEVHTEFMHEYAECMYLLCEGGREVGGRQKMGDGHN